MRSTRRRSLALLLGPAAVVGMIAGGATTVSAYPGIGAVMSFSAGCTSANPGQSCALALCITAASGGPQADAAVSIASSDQGAARVQPASAVTGPDGCATGLTVITGPGCGPVTLSATSAVASAQTVLQVVCPTGAGAAAAVTGGVAGASALGPQGPQSGGGAGLTQPSPSGDGGGGGRPPRTGGTPPGSSGGRSLPLGLIAGVPGGGLLLGLVALLLVRAGLLGAGRRSTVLVGTAQDATELAPGLLLGSAPDGARRRRLARAGVSRVVDLRGAAAAGLAWPEGVAVTRVVLEDGAAPPLDELETLLAGIEADLQEGHKLLIHCTGGLGRAATVAVALLVRRGYSLPHAYRLLRDKRPQVAPSDAQLAALAEYARRLGRDAGVPSASG